jgi:hypothetical protein
VLSAVFMLGNPNLNGLGSPYSILIELGRVHPNKLNDKPNTKANEPAEERNHQPEDNQEQNNSPN